jgi:hypothetical protein
MNGMTADDIEIAVHWGGEVGKFAAAAISVGFIVKKDGSYAINGWEEHNPWAFGSEERSNAARDKAAKRWAKRNGADCNADGIAGSNADGNGF